MATQRRCEGDDAARPLSPQQVEQIQRLAASMRYGSISLVFQDGRLVQIDRNEKFRLH